MTSDAPTPNPESRAFNPKFRKRRRWQGSTWTPNTISADSQSGVWCPRHRMRHGYKSSKLGVQYDRRTNGTWVILWTCADTGDVLKEMELNNE